VPSTVIRRFDYRPDERELDISFTTGRRYLYHDVPPEAAAALRSAFNKGRHFNSRIRGAYRYTELEPAEEG
jgi:KTSC domain-containing protein